MKKPLPLLSPNDPPAMANGVRRLQEAGHLPRRTSPYQLKIGPINFWPSKGTIGLDDGRTLTCRGITALLEVLEAPHHDLEAVIATCKAKKLLEAETNIVTLHLS